MKVLLLSPHYPPEMLSFTRGLAEVGAEVWASADIPVGQLPDGVRQVLAGYIQAPILSESDGVEALAGWVERHGFDRIESLWEPCVVLAARLREVVGAPGITPGQARRCRDKGLMKDAVAAAGLRVPRSQRANTVPGALEAAEIVGFPLVIKPIAGAGTKDTHRADDEAQLRAFLDDMGHVAEVSIEEYIDGDEYTFDAISVGGQTVFESVSQYHPRPLIARNEEWISPAQHTFADPLIPALTDGVALGRAVLGALELQTGFTHMEWFRKPDGEVVFGEIGARSGGGLLVDQMNFANDIDAYREWARAICWGCFEAVPSRAFHCGTTFKRAIGQGRITRIEGIDRVQQRCSGSIVLADLLPIGAHRRDWRNTLVSDGHVTVRHPDMDECLAMMRFVAGELRLFAG